MKDMANQVEIIRTHWNLGYGTIHIHYLST